MKRYLIVGAIIAGLAVLLWHWRRGEGSTPKTDAAPETRALAVSVNRPDAERPAIQNRDRRVEQPTAITNEPLKDDRALAESPAALQAYNDKENGPVAFYGLVVDQDTNALANVTVDLEVTEVYRRPNFAVSGSTTNLQRQTGADGRFEVSGLKGHDVIINRFTKEGYEPELEQKVYGSYGGRNTSFESPVVLRMWRTNLHEPLITGDKYFVVIPDGRHYAIDLIKGTIAVGDDGDLVAWIKRPEPVRWGQRYDWSCEVMAPSGGLRGESNYAMFTAPGDGYTNVFAYQEEATLNGWGGATGDKRFYVRLRNGQMYGRITISLYADYNKDPALIRLSYAVNPSGSRLLR